MLLKVSPEGELENMQISKFNDMSLFQTLINSEMKEITVTYRMPKVPVRPFHQDQTRSLSIPLNPDFQDLEKIEVVMYKSPTLAYKMPDEFNSWFSNCFGFSVILAYLGDFERQTMGSVSPNYLKKVSMAEKKSSWFSGVSSFLPLPGQFQSLENEEPLSDGISFSDCAPFLVVTLSSLATIHPRLRETDGEESPDLNDDRPVEEMDMKKFRPNVVLDGDYEAPWDEDFWGELEVSSTASTSSPQDSDGLDTENESQNEKESKSSTNVYRIILTANCGRCTSINIDYETGKPGTGPSGNALKKLMRDRRVDKGTKYSPIFGRYGFLDNSGSKKGLGGIRVGDEVVVSKRNEERTVFREWAFYDFLLRDFNLSLW